MHLEFNRGTIIIRGNARVPNSTWDERSRSFRAMALYYKDIIDYLRSSGLEFIDNVLDLMPCPELKSGMVLRDYQEQALDAWIANDKRGVVVLPTGSGKTILGIRAISLLNTPAIVVAPTIDLMNQWRTRLKEEFKIDIGILGGGEQEIRAITVSTYDSAYIHAERLGNRFGLIIFDEVHHLPAEGYRHIALMFASPFRMGLTATYEREDGLHTELNRLVGGKVFEKKVKELAGEHLSPYRLEKISVELIREEKEEYNLNHGIFSEYLKKNNIMIRNPSDFQELVIRSGRDPGARAALLARNTARDIALNSASKVEKLAEILKKHGEGRVFIFTEHNKLVYRISREFLIPAITYRTASKERNEILERFKSGIYKAVVTSKVLDEGIDVPDADVGIIISGTGSERAFVQRLGRILRKKRGKEAILYEIVSSETSEIGTARRRTKSMR
ncbi:DNA/RNA helicase, superfamily II [Candidatus Methanoperedens nitroreducens]|uniref:DNA 3'-5' helicase n=2 Tax=Candidatus Methanoperedens nitratireducens TaxID=1392998 RepID=A0A062V0G7_9EURY|nr:DEAD/DEAH box helicase family protein [Candidatus Methanoperedens nitroreducens]KCZ70867.1 DNA/RNA helicase, superfamily II [Candidatus Methanoperedens nitroreducens]